LVCPGPVSNADWAESPTLPVGLGVTYVSDPPLSSRTWPGFGPCALVPASMAATRLVSAMSRTRFDPRYWRLSPTPSRALAITFLAGVATGGAKVTTVGKPFWPPGAVPVRNGTIFNPYAGRLFRPPRSGFSAGRVTRFLVLVIPCVRYARRSAAVRGGVEANGHADLDRRGPRQFPRDCLKDKTSVWRIIAGPWSSELSTRTKTAASQAARDHSATQWHCRCHDWRPGPRRSAMVDSIDKAGPPADPGGVTSTRAHCFVWPDHDFRQCSPGDVCVSGTDSGNRPGGPTAGGAGTRC